MGLTALHLAALMQNDKVDAALGATAPTSALGLRWPHPRIYAYLYLCVYVDIFIKSVSTSTPAPIIYSHRYPHGRCRRAAEAHTQVVDPQLGAPRRRTVMGSPIPPCAACAAWRLRRATCGSGDIVGRGARRS
jgi:hypothetical protein